MDELNGGYSVRDMSYSNDFVNDGNVYGGFGISVRCVHDGSGTSSFGASGQTKTDDILKLFRLAEMDKLIRVMIAQRKKTMSIVPSSIWDRIEKILTSEYLNACIPVYDKYYTHDEIKQLILFHESPIGKKSIELVPIIYEETSAIGIKLANKLIEELEKEGYFR